MNPLLKKSACELADLLRSGEITSVELTQACLDRIDAIDPKVHAFLYVDREGALATAADVDARRAAGEELPRLAGVPIAVKDNMVTRGVPTTCASKILEGWLPPYDATVVELLLWAPRPSPPLMVVPETPGILSVSPAAPEAAPLLLLLLSWHRWLWVLIPVVRSVSPAL